jgi:NAD(P)-dependent dehydrogenase (short-subunit alcohol dehydrogenase family)
MQPLGGRVAVVAGATRGAGRGIARALGEAGATVYCTGRSVRGHPSPYNRPETIEETAGLVTAAGGTGVAVRVDHTAEAEVRGLFARVDAEQGRLDVLVDCVAGEDPTFAWNDRVREVDADGGLELMRQAVFSHLRTARHAALLMARRRAGLIVEVTDRDTFAYQGYGVMHDLAKFTLVRLAFILAEELRGHRVAAVAVTPGYLRSESMLERWGVTEQNWREAGKKDPNFLESETPLFVGRCVAALAADPKVLERSGDATSSWELAREYGVVDADGRRPDLGARLTAIARESRPYRESLRRSLRWQERIARRTEGYLGAERQAGGEQSKTAEADRAGGKHHRRG